MPLPDTYKFTALDMQVELMPLSPNKMQSVSNHNFIFFLDTRYELQYGYFDVQYNKVQAIFFLELHVEKAGIYTQPNWKTEKHITKRDSMLWLSGFLNKT